MLNSPLLVSRRALFAIVLLPLFLIGAVTGDESQIADVAKGDNSQNILRFNPLSGTLEKIENKELKAGYMYNQFDHELKRRVWSFWNSDGTFRHAFGEGTTLEAWRFDLGISRESAIGQLQKIDPDLAEHLQQSGQTLRYQLDDDGRWTNSGTIAVLSIFDLKTGYRWEKHAYKYIPVSHTGGYRWRILKGKYVPVN